MSQKLNNILLQFKKLLSIVKVSPHDDTSLEGKSFERYRRIIFTGGSTAIVKIVTTSISLITVPLTVKYLGSERYGLWMSITSIIALMTFADLGLGNGLLNEISRAKAQKNDMNASVAVSSTFFILSFISLLLMVIFFILYPYISWYKLFNVKSDLAISESAPTMFILVFFFLLNMPLGIVQRIQEGYQEGYIFQVWLILGAILSLIFLIVIIHCKLGLPWLVLSISIAPFISILFNSSFLFFKKRKYLIPKFKNYNSLVANRLIHSGLRFFILGVLTLITNSSDDIIIAHTIGISSVAGFEIVKKLFLFSMVVQFVIQPLWPAFAEAIEAKDYDWAKKTLKKGIIYSILISSITSIILVFFGSTIIEVWVGKQYSPSINLLISFFFFSLLSAYGGVMSTFLNSGPLLSKQTIFLSIASITSIILKFILSSKIGVSGVIWANVLAYSIFYILPSYYLAKNFLNHDSKIQTGN